MIEKRIYDYAYKYLSDYIPELEEDISKADSKINGPEIIKLLNQRLEELKQDLEFVEKMLY